MGVATLPSPATSPDATGALPCAKWDGHGTTAATRCVHVLGVHLLGEARRAVARGSRSTGASSGSGGRSPPNVARTCS